MPEFRYGQRGSWIARVYGFEVGVRSAPVALWHKWAPTLLTIQKRIIFKPH